MYQFSTGNGEGQVGSEDTGKGGLPKVNCIRCGEPLTEEDYLHWESDGVWWAHPSWEDDEGQLYHRDCYEKVRSAWGML